MQLNGIDLIGYNHHGTVLETVLDTDFATANKLDGKELKVTEGEKDIQVFGGYRLTSLKVRSDGRTEAIFVIKVDSNISQTLSAIQKDLDINKRDIQSARSTANSAQSSASNATSIASQNSSRYEELASEVEAYAEAIEAISAQVFVDEV